LELDPKDDRTRYYQGLALIRLDRIEEAQKEFEQILEFSKDKDVIDLASSQMQLIQP
jgi:Flp pilus assembly protein TadD